MPRHHDMSDDANHASVGIFGVYFLYANAGLDWNPHYVARWWPLLDMIGHDIHWVSARQRRHYVSYWDAMTWLESNKGRTVLNERLVEELPFLRSVMRMLARGQVDDAVMEELALYPSLKDVATIYRWYDAKRPLFRSPAEARANVARFVTTPQGQLRLKNSGICREFKLDMGDAGGSLKSVSWERLLVLALLIQIRADVTGFYETGLQRLARCQHRDCQAWFVRKPMGQQQRFCSDVCRALSHRKKARRTRSSGKST